MKNKAQTQSEEPKRQKTAEPSDRRTTDRRKCKGDGYTYIPMVGWYCRRAEKRRDDDELK